MELVLTSNSPVQSLICDHKEEFLALREKVSSLEVFLKNNEKINVSREMTDLEVRIKEVANVVENTIQLRVTEVVTAYDEMQREKAHEKLSDSIQQVAEDIDRVQNESPKIQDKGKQASNKSLVKDSSSTEDIPNVKNVMVGRDDEKKRLLQELTRSFSGGLKVIPIIGMGGIGKTTLVNEVYYDESILYHFDVHAWATISQQHNVKEILLSLLKSTIKVDGMEMKDEGELADMLQKSLKGKRYLIVMDDIWSSEAWDDVRQCFPIQNNESRILLTTRNSEVACYAGTQNLSFQMGFMDQDESWNLFKSAAFANEEFPSEFKTIGKQIVERCQGLPLTIVVVAGLLCKSKRTIEDWQSVAEDVKSFVTNDPDKQCLHVLGLSYNHLTSDLKACLLYFVIFPQGRKVSVKRLVRLWLAEGFLKLEKDLEGVAEKCLQDLIDRCLVLVSDKSLDETRIRYCKVHDLIYEMCLNEAQSNNIFVMNDIVFDYGPNHVPPECHHLTRHKMFPSKQRIDDQIYNGSYRALLTPGDHHFIKRQTDDDNNLLKQTRSIFSFCRYSSTFSLKSELKHFKLLRILDLGPIRFDNFPPQILCLIWLRYLVLSGRFDIPPEICRLWNLQTFIVEWDSAVNAIFPQKFWELMHLRHLKLGKFCLPNPPSVSVDEERCLGFSNAERISGLCASNCTKEVISGIRNVKHLSISGDEYDYESFQESRLFDNLARLHQLETLSLKLYTFGMSKGQISPATIPSAKAFPATLKKIKFICTHLRWEYLDIIGELPNLEVLKLMYDACYGKEWNSIAGGFTGLKLLLIDESNLKFWKATNDNFPVLERLVIRDCYKLEEIPIEFADINTLQLIELEGCKPALKASTEEIQQVQEDYGAEPVHVRFLQPYSGEYNIV
ncbi:hypothetical protein HAX54_009725 [Datura stramonium]|uniref:NB-ARC domain-containing protein n=1 Tax=Datura stramonium TaxID=4076 RepID=A0ABS8WY17_DATST|nr:hypothetical protein [Datura stramonium]